MKTRKGEDIVNWRKARGQEKTIKGEEVDQMKELGNLIKIEEGGASQVRIGLRGKRNKIKGKVLLHRIHNHQDLRKNILKRTENL